MNTQPSRLGSDPTSTPVGPATGARMSAVMEGLAADARAARDAVVNTLDGVDRQTKLASRSLARQVQRFCADRAQQLRAEGGGVPGGGRSPERDARFEPEDEWELRGRAATDAADRAAARDSAGTSAAAPDSGDDDDDLPETWLR